MAIGCLAAGLLAAVPAAANASTSNASTSNDGFVSFQDFLADTASAGYQSFVTAENGNAADTANQVHTQSAFDQMRTYILNTYRGVSVTHSYVFGGAYFDCVTTMSQPSVRDEHVTTLATPPAAPTAPKAATVPGKRAASPLGLGLHDAYGNAVSCPAGSIPMRRISLDQTTRFPSLAAFLAKEPSGVTPSARPITTPGGPHRYAYGYQNGTNYGGNSWLNLWNPTGDFTLSQQWYVNGSGSGTQTAEGGWVDYPGKFGNQSVLFIFFTPDNYASGCYNLECSGFVQTNSSIALGTTWSAYSSYGGDQYGFSLQYEYSGGNWWLFVQGTALGYYPGSVYNGGPMASNASLSEFGGETYTDGSNWPQMGSGQFSGAGWQQAAFQNDIFYISDTSGDGIYSSLNPVATNPGCYTINYTPASSGGSWGTYFYYGGPGGNC
jgi:hypothetical protein